MALLKPRDATGSPRPSLLQEWTRDPNIGAPRVIRLPSLPTPTLYLTPFTLGHWGFGAAWTSCCGWQGMCNWQKWSQIKVEMSGYY